MSHLPRSRGKVFFFFKRFEIRKLTVTKIIKRTVNVYALGAKQLSIKSDNFFKKNSRTKRLGETAAETLPWKIYIQNKKNVYLTPLPPFPSKKKKKLFESRKKTQASS